MDFPGNLYPEHNMHNHTIFKILHHRLLLFLFFYQDNLHIDNSVYDLFHY